MYSRATTILLDDPISAVDSVTAKHIAERCFQNDDLMKGRTVILVSHRIRSLLPAASLVVVLGPGGRVAQAAAPAGISVDDALIRAIEEDSPSASSAVVPGATTPLPVDVETLVPTSAGKSVGTARRLYAEEDRQKGRVSTNNYLFILSTAGPVWYLLLLVSLYLIHRFTYIACLVYLEKWTASDLGPTQERYMVLYIVGTVIRAFAVAASWIVLYGWGSVGFSSGVGKKMHSMMFKRLSQARLGFFDRVPMGRILSRFAGDTWLIDTQLSDDVGRTAMVALEFLSAVVVVTTRQPIFLIAIIGLAIPFCWIGNFFARLRAETQRLRSCADSPLLCTYVELIINITSLRAYGAQRRSCLAAARFLDFETRSSVSNNFVWTTFQLVTGGLSNLLVAVVSAYLISKDLPAAQAAFLLTYANIVSYSLCYLLEKMQNLEQSMVSAERIHEMCTLPPIEPLGGNISPPEDWPQHGMVQYEHVSARYADDLPNVLDNISFELQAGMRMGIVGATGGGKSSLALSLFRTLEVCEGKIIIDSIDISEIPLKTLRQRLSAVPQEPVLTSGTLRDALDVSRTLADADVYDVLRRVHLLPPPGEPMNSHARRFADLDSYVAIEGNNFSLGEKQLLSLARALLKRSKILVMDEATSNIDSETDKLIQATLASLKGITIITIAHRLETIMNYDRLLVMEKGRVAEYDSPAALLKKPNGLLRRLVDESGESALLEEMAADIPRHA